jgi:hypothetical protein
MPRAYARFASSPIGPALAVTDGGLVLTTNVSGVNTQRAARGNILHSMGQHGAGFLFWGEANLVAAVGLVQASASLSAEVGTVAGSVGWRLDQGQVRLGGVLQASGLALPVKQQVIGVLFRDAPGGAFFVDFFRDTTFVTSVALPSGLSWHFAVSLASPNPGDLNCVVNTGQWPALGPADGQGWDADPPVFTPRYLATRHFISAAGDAVPHQRYEGMLSKDGIETYAEVGFWPWENAISPRGSSAQAVVFDSNGLLDGVIAEGQIVSVRLAEHRGSVNSAANVGRFVVDSIDAESDTRKRLRLRDPHDSLDEAVNRAVFLPIVQSLAWRPQPILIGAMCSVPLLPTNSDGTVSYLCDAPLQFVNTILDRGDPLEVGTWSMVAGNQQVLLDSPPQGPALADEVSAVAGGSTVQPATLQQAMHQIMSRGGVRYWASTDCAAIDAAGGYAGVGFYSDNVVSLRQARDTLLANYCGAAYADQTGALRFTRLVDPAVMAIDFSFDDSMLASDAVYAPDMAPNLSRRMLFRPNASPMSAGDFVTDLVDVPVSRRQELMASHRSQVYSALPLAQRYVAAERREPMRSGFWREVDAQSELDRICALYAVERNFWSFEFRGQHAVVVLPGHCVFVRYPRYGLQLGRPLFVAAVRQNRTTGRLSLKLWG